MTPPGRWIAIDYGRKRIGLAVCDALGITTRPLAVLRSTTLEEDLQAIARWCKDEQVAGVVIGVPVQLDGEVGRAANEVRLFAAVLRERLGLQVEEVDERLTTKGAHALLKEAGHRHARRKAKLDSTAAMLILRSWLDARKRA
jgi:putative Holliday junction resolvase